jgi:hypothetical protein
LLSLEKEKKKGKKIFQRKQKSKIIKVPDLELSSRKALHTDFFLFLFFLFLFLGRFPIIGARGIVLSGQMVSQYLKSLCVTQ